MLLALLELLKLLKLLIIGILVLIELHEVAHDVYWNWKYNGAIVLRRDAVQCLQITKLKQKWLNINNFCVTFTCSAAGLSVITSAACLRDLLALCSPSAAITFALASLAASASAAIALISCAGTRTSFTSTRSTLTPHGSVATSKVSYYKKFMTHRNIIMYA